jgi:DNA ligase-1
VDRQAGCHSENQCVLLEAVARTSSVVAETGSRLAKRDAIAACLQRLGTEEVPIAVAYLAGELPHGPIGVGWAALRDLPTPARAPSLELLEVDSTLRKVGAATGAGSQSVRRALLADLLRRATEPEQRFLVALLLGELRQGALTGVMVDAIAKAAGIPAAALRRAHMLCGDLRVVATAALAEGEASLERFHLDVLRPLQPMLAQTADDLAEALTRVGGPAAVEWKLDGARIQVHRLEDEVRVFTRNLADITARVPEVVDATRGLPARALVLDGEAIALAESGRPRAFQVTMSRFGSRDIEELRRAVPLSAVFFDCLHVDGEDLLDRPAAERLAAVDALVPEQLRVPRVTTDDPAVAERFLDDALERGHEGVMVKALEAPYEAGRRGAGWLKVKRADTLDLAVLAAEWGHGRRRGWLSNLHLGARDAQTGELVMLGKTFKGLTDQMLAWQTERLLQLETHRDSHTVYVRPELVVEVAFDGVQGSSRYPGGVALRFARVKGYRTDKRPDETDTIEAVRSIHERRA